MTTSKRLPLWMNTALQGMDHTMSSLSRSGEATRATAERAGSERAGASRVGAKQPHRIACTLVLVVALVTLSGCLGARKDLRRYYSLPSMKALAGQAQATPQPGTLFVAGFGASTVHDRVGLVLRRSDVELRYSEQHNWVKRPQHLVSDRVAESIVRAGVVSRVVRDLGVRAPDWVLRGKLLAMEVLTGPDGGGPWRVRVALRMTLRSVKDGRVLWRGSWDQTASVASPEADAAARKMGTLLDSGVQKLLKPLKISLQKAKVTKAD